MTNKTNCAIASRLRSICICALFFLCIVSCSRQPVYPEPPIKGSDVVIDTNKLVSECPVFYTFRNRGKDIRFFVFKSRDKVLSFLDACAKCYPSKLGYRVSDGHITCRKCDVRYSLSNIEEGFSSCFPMRIEGHLQGVEYRIPISRLEEVADKF